MASAIALICLVSDLDAMQVYIRFCVFLFRALQQMMTIFFYFYMNHLFKIRPDGVQARFLHADLHCGLCH